MAEHTPARVYLDGRGFRPDTRNGGSFVPLLETPIHWVADLREPRERAERLVASYNACLGIPTASLEEGVVADMREALEKVRAWLRQGNERAPLKRAEAEIAKGWARAAFEDDVLAALSKAKGEG